MNDELPIFDNISDHFDSARDQRNMLYVMSDVVKGIDHGEMLGGLMRTEVQAAFHPMVADMFWPKIESLTPGDEEQVMTIVDALSRSAWPQIREQVADHFQPAYEYLRGHDGVMAVIDRLQGDEETDISVKMQVACHALGIVRPQKPDLTAPAELPKPRRK